MCLDNRISTFSLLKHIEPILSKQIFKKSGSFWRKHEGLTRENLTWQTFFLHAKRMYEGIGNIIPHIFNVTLDGESSALRSDRFNSGEKNNLCSFYRRPSRLKSWSQGFEVEKNLMPLLGIELQFLSSPACHLITTKNRQWTQRSEHGKH